MESRSRRDAPIAVHARDAAASGSSVVITHGTDTLEETAYLTDLVAGETTDHAPIVVTGSMRTGEPDGDGPQNLRDAFGRRSPEAPGRGVMVVARARSRARWVTKTDTQRSTRSGRPDTTRSAAWSTAPSNFDARRRGALRPEAAQVVQGPVASSPHTVTPIPS